MVEIDPTAVRIEQLEPLDPVGRHKTEQNRTVGTEQLELLGLASRNRTELEQNILLHGLVGI